MKKRVWDPIPVMVLDDGTCDGYVAVSKEGRWVGVGKISGVWKVLLEAKDDGPFRLEVQKECKTLYAAKRWAALHIGLCRGEERWKCRGRYMGYIK